MLRGCLVDCEYLELNDLQLKKLYPVSTLFRNVMKAWGNRKWLILIISAFNFPRAIK